MKEKKEIKAVGFGFFEALTLLFIALKLTGCIAWSWLWVLSPLWLTSAVVALIILIILLTVK